MRIDLKGTGVSGFSIGIDPTGREHAVVVAKRRLEFPVVSGDLCTWSDHAPELCQSDEFSGELGLTAVTFESDFALRKPFCDVIISGAAYAPQGAPAPLVYAMLQCGPISKTLAVFGHRVWERFVLGQAPSAAIPFDRQVISYDVAFGGSDALDPTDETPAMYPENTVGVGWHRRRNRSFIEGIALPNCEDPHHLISAPWDTVTPASFGPLARGAPARAKFAGTYDDAWVENRFPHLPDDYDDRYAQSAPLDQQMRHPVGGEIIKLGNLTPNHDGLFEMRLPKLDLPFVFSRKHGQDIATQSVTDTIIIEPDTRHIDVVTRASIPLKRDILEMKDAIIGERSRGFWRARTLGKTYYAGLGGLSLEHEVQAE